VAHSALEVQALPVATVGTHCPPAQESPALQSWLEVQVLAQTFPLHG
jgi:hypothetical protein